MSNNIIKIYLQRLGSVSEIYSLFWKLRLHTSQAIDRELCVFASCRDLINNTLAWPRRVCWPSSAFAARTICHMGPGSSSSQLRRWCFAQPPPVPSREDSQCVADTPASSSFPAWCHGSRMMWLRRASLLENRWIALSGADPKSRCRRLEGLYTTAGLDPSGWGRVSLLCKRNPLLLLRSWLRIWVGTPSGQTPRQTVARLLGWTASANEVLLVL